MEKDLRPIKIKLATLPDAPGVYKYLDKSGELLYIGKAINLRKRVYSYFTNNNQHNGKTRVLVSKIWDVNVTVVPTEMDALLLENSLIKEFQPKYNIALKDDKSFPLIKITNERFPRVLTIRNPTKDGSNYFGPFTNVKMMRIVLDLCKKLYPTRTCTLNLSKKNVEGNKFKVCLEYQIGNCKGPCQALQSEEDYLESIAQIKHILQGNLKIVKDQLKLQMKGASETWRFEEAEKIKQKLNTLRAYQSRSTVVNSKINDVDVFNIVENHRYAYINYLRIQSGIIIQSKNLEIKKKLEETKEELLEKAVIHFTLTDRFTEDYILPFEVNLPLTYTIPKLGDKKTLLEISYKNALFYMREKTSQYEKLNPDLKVERLMQLMKKELRLSEEPAHIECFDNSNIQGAFPVSACVVFRYGKPSKKEYRHFNVQSVEGPDDFASMYEAVTRRYTRVLSDGHPLPQLILIDGGKGQLSSSVAALKDLGIYGKVAIIGIAKRLEELYYPDDSDALHIDKKSETLKVLQQLRDEAHRFGITHHRNRRSKGTILSELTAIKGIGMETAAELLRHFKSVNKIKIATIEQLTTIVGNSKANIILNYFEQK